MVPVLLLTGFLGSGKTTLLNRLLDERPVVGPFAENAGKLALIVNEFGDVGIDGDLLPDEMTRQIEIKGGCICCRLDEDLEKTLNELMDTQPDLSAIVIETTGIAEPLPISWTLAKEELANRFRLGAVITVVDALEHERHRLLSPSVDAQVEYADILVISKLDLAGEIRSSEVKTSLRTLNGVAPFLAGITSEMVGQLWQMLDDPELESPQTRQQPQGEKPKDKSTHSFQSAVLPIDSILDFEVLTEELEALSADYVRIKGIAVVVDRASGSAEPQMIAFHRVGARVSWEPFAGLREGRKTCIVAIGRGVVSHELEVCVRAAELSDDVSTVDESQLET